MNLNLIPEAVEEIVGNLDLDHKVHVAVPAAMDPRETAFDEVYQVVKDSAQTPLVVSRRKKLSERSRPPLDFWLLTPLCQSVQSEDRMRYRVL